MGFIYKYHQSRFSSDGRFYLVEPKKKNIILRFLKSIYLVLTVTPTYY